MNFGKKIVIGVGCRRECSAEEIIELIHKVMTRNNLYIVDISAIATAWMKEGAWQIMDAADALALPLIVVPQEKCEEMSNATHTVSQKVVELFAVPSVAEVAALAAVGKNSKLLCSRINSANASCAIAVDESYSLEENPTCGVVV